MRLNILSLYRKKKKYSLDSVFLSIVESKL